MIRLLQVADAESYVALREEALRQAPLAFAASPEDDQASRLESVRELLGRGPDGVVFGAFHPLLVGVLGMYRDRHQKAAHKAHLWGMYVVPARRRRGIATALLQAAVAHACTLPGVCRLHLGVTADAPEARRLYEHAGFTVWGTEPDALRYQGRSVVEYHMALNLP